LFVCSTGNKTAKCKLVECQSFLEQEICKVHEDKIPHESLEEKLKVEMEVSLISIHNSEHYVS